MVCARCGMNSISQFTAFPEWILVLIMCALSTTIRSQSVISVYGARSLPVMSNDLQMPSRMDVCSQTKVPVYDVQSLPVITDDLLITSLMPVCSESKASDNDARDSECVYSFHTIRIMKKQQVGSMEVTGINGESGPSEDAFGELHWRHLHLSAVVPSPIYEAIVMS